MDSYSFYNSSSRVGSHNAVEQVEAASKVQNSSDDDISRQNQSESKAIYQREDYSGPKETQVSSDNNYQKQMIQSRTEFMDRLAGKLMDTLPRIFSDIADMSPEGVEVAAADSKVVISDSKNAQEYMDRQLQSAQMQDIAIS